MVKKKRSRLGAATELANIVNSSLGKPVMKLGIDSTFEIVRIPTGSLVIDRITGGGFALGRSVELYGDESACKSYLAYRTMALSQQRGNLCALVDPERAFDPVWFRHLGGIPEELLIYPDRESNEADFTADEAIGVMLTLADHAVEKSLEVVTIDSVAALVPQEEKQKDPREEARIAGQARMMSRALRRITNANFRTLYIWLNQERMNVRLTFGGSPRTTPGGRALRFYATSRIELRRAQKVTEGMKRAERGNLKGKDVPVGAWIQARSEKDKSTKPHMTGSFIFDNRKSEIDLTSEIIQLGLEDDLIEKNGNTYAYESVSGEIFKGTWKPFKKLIRENSELQDELVEAIEDMSVQLAKADA
jgi:recombination protein RecA